MNYKLFCGDRFYPNGGYEDFKGFFYTIDDAKKYIIELYDDKLHNDMWAHIVLKDTILLYGKLDVFKTKQWVWWEGKYNQKVINI